MSGTQQGESHGDDRAKRVARAPISVRESSGHLVTSRTAEPPPAPSREFTLDDEGWIARLTGEGYGGTGEFSPGFFVAIRFYRTGSPDDPVREVLAPRGRFETLYDDELRELFARARPLDRSHRD